MSVCDCVVGCVLCGVHTQYTLQASLTATAVLHPGPTPPLSDVISLGNSTTLTLQSTHGDSCGLTCCFLTMCGVVWCGCGWLSLFVPHICPCKEVVFMKYECLVVRKVLWNTGVMSHKLQTCP